MEAFLKHVPGQVRVAEVCLSEIERLADSSSESG